ncbi:hypothetical protein X474_26330 [Dethiosulfatarculus sandiegensis]|uniref:FecR protein domain-containing protein n=1 Tax=Dethiosulfatarculus sandiegensis TaxID=1429043 RepID=A0A0D2G8A9_9BACT|nr:hypothetical protein X474_26330 [Dethiosulfatarculus sandiegensis]
MKKYFLFFVLICLLVLPCKECPADSEPVIGSVRTVSGQAYVLRGELRLKADISLQLKEGDVMTTGSPGSMGVILRDDTVLSLGPDSRLELNQFTFVPAKGEMSLFTRMLKGTATYLSGTIGKLAPEKVKMETPQTTIGIRGTRFLIRVSPP